MAADRRDLPLGTSISFETRYAEFRDAIHFGFAFRGPEVALAARHRWRLGPGLLQAGLAVGGGGNAASIGLWGFRVNLEPVRTRYLLRAWDTDRVTVFVGPTFGLSFDVQSYAELHGGQLSWLTDYSFGVQAIARISAAGRIVEGGLTTTALSLTSRPPEARDPYSRTVGASDVLAEFHSGMHLGSFERFARICWRAELFFNTSLPSSLRYEGSFVGYFRAPTYYQFTHGVSYALGF